MTAVEDGFVSPGSKGFLIKQDHRDAPAVRKTRSRGFADLGGLPGEPTHREIDWLVFSKELKGGGRPDWMATLVYPAPAEGIDPSRVSVDRIDLSDDDAAGYRIRTKDREDLVILSDGTYRHFTGTIAGDFTFARISFSGGAVDYAGFTHASRITIAGMPAQSFAGRTDFEYQR